MFLSFFEESSSRPFIWYPVYENWMSSSFYRTYESLINKYEILSNFPLWAAITQLAHNCSDVNMGFQKLETITFDLMYVDKCCFSE